MCKKKAVFMHIDSKKQSYVHAKPAWSKTYHKTFFIRLKKMLDICKMSNYNPLVD